MLTVNKYNREHVLRILKWCVDKWGKSDFANSLPRITVYKSSGNTRKIKGEYIAETNKIIIYLGAIDEYEELCEIIIHEYTHYMQDNNEFDEIYYKLKDKGIKEMNIYKTHPHEIKCRIYGRQYAEICSLETKKT